MLNASAHCRLCVHARSRPSAYTSRNATAAMPLRTPTTLKQTFNYWRVVSPLRPRQPVGLPTTELASVTIGVEWPFEPIRHVAAARVARCRHCLGCLQTALARATDEEQFAVAVGTNGSERFGEALDECRVKPVVRKALPFDQHGSLADRRQIRQANIGPFRDRTHVDQHRSRITLQTRPCLFHRNGFDVDLTHVSLHP